MLLSSTAIIFMDQFCNGVYYNLYLIRLLYRLSGIKKLMYVKALTTDPGTQKMLYSFAIINFYYYYLI